MRSTMLAIAAALAGCTTSLDPHALEACTITGAVSGGQPVDASCEEACGGVDFRETFDGPTCSSSSRASALGNADAASCHYTEGPDGTTGCCTIVYPSQDARIHEGFAFVFFECDGSGQ